jgi:hypothetical protein
MRVETQSGRVLAFDNLPSHQATGTTPWQQQIIVLDVPAESATISFGFLLAGTGEAKATAFEFNVVDATVPTTAPQASTLEPALPNAPVNLEFRL